MSNPVVLITGALTGIGRAAAVAFAKKGANVFVAGRRDEAGKALVKELHSFGSEAEFINADVRKEDDVRALVDKTVARFGRLDVAVNNAGTEGQVGPITDQTAESYAATFDTNVLGVILSMKHEVRVMQGQGRALSRCQIEHATNLPARQVHAAATTSRHVRRADALKARCVLAEVRWRWTLKLLWAAACTERNLCADPTLLNPCILRSRRRVG